MATDLVQNADGSIGLLDEQTGYQVAKFGGPAASGLNIVQWRGLLIMKVGILGGTDTAGGVCSLANPFGATLYIDRARLVVTTIATGACTASFGAAAANGTTSDSTLFSGTDVHAATGSFAYTTGTAVWTAATFLTGSKASGASAGLVGHIALMGYLS